MRFSANEYYALANADCISVAKLSVCRLTRASKLLQKLYILRTAAAYTYFLKRIIGIVIQTAEGAFRLIW